MKNKISAPVLLLAGIILSSCSRTILLQSTFENDRVGSQPDRTLPGDPTGDMIRYDEGIAPRIRVQNSTTSGEKALHFTQIPLANDVSETRVWLNFRGAGTSSDKNLQFSWTGQHQNGGFPDQYVIVDISDGGTKTIARLYFYADGTIKKVEDIYSDRQSVIGKIDPSLRHIVVVQVDIRAKTYKLNIIMLGTIRDTRTYGPISEDGLPFNSGDISINSTNPINPNVAIRLDNGGNERRKYIIDRVDISQEN